MSEHILLAIICDRKCDTCRVDRACEFNEVVEQVGIFTEMTPLRDFVATNHVDVIAIDLYQNNHSVVMIADITAHAPSGVHIVINAENQDFETLHDSYSHKSFVHVTHRNELENLLNQKFHLLRNRDGTAPQAGTTMQHHPATSTDRTLLAPTMSPPPPEKIASSHIAWSTTHRSLIQRYLRGCNSRV